MVNKEQIQTLKALVERELEQLVKETKRDDLPDFLVDQLTAECMKLKGIISQVENLENNELMNPKKDESKD